MRERSLSLLAFLHDLYKVRQKWNDRVSRRLHASNTSVTLRCDLFGAICRSYEEFVYPTLDSACA